MKRKLLLVIIAITLFPFPEQNFGQVIVLGTAANFVIYTTAGAVGNTGISQITGNVGTHIGDITGFDSVNGDIHNADSATAQCSTDLQAAWYQLDTITPTFIHGPVLGNGDTLFSGVYSLADAGSLASILTLDAQGNSNAVFIFKIGGAFTTAASSSINLINGALAGNVFLKAEGAVSMAAGTTLSGTFIANNGAIEMAAGSTIEGRMLSTTGAVNVDGVVAYIPQSSGIALPINLLSFTGAWEESNVLLKWSTATETNNDYFTVEKSKDGLNFEPVDTVDGAGNSYTTLYYLTVDNHPHTGISYYRLMQTDFDGRFEYSAVRSVNTPVLLLHVVVFPNPVVSHLFYIRFDGGEIPDAVILYNIAGKAVASTNRLIGKNIMEIDLEHDLLPGVYFLQWSGKPVKLILL